MVGEYINGGNLIAPNKGDKEIAERINKSVDDYTNKNYEMHRLDRYLLEGLRGKGVVCKTKEEIDAYLDSL